MGFCHHRYYMLQLFFLIFSCFCILAATRNTIETNESLRSSDTLISSGNRFKLSFFSPPNSSHSYVGIMFNLPVMTVVWVANRNKPLNDSTGTLEISSDGNLVILNGRKEKVWSTNLSTSVANASAVLLDTGNLVLQANNNDAHLWESFQHASDSFIEGMKILTDLNKNEKNVLTSWRSPDDPAPGSFTTSIEPLDIPQLFVWKDGKTYWRSGPWNGQVFTGLPALDSVYNDGYAIFKIPNNDGSDSPRTAYAIFTLPDPSVLLYYALNPSGSVEEKKWSDEKKAWDVTWSSTSNECEMYGNCGSFGSCNFQDIPICTCFPGFVPKYKDEWEAGNWTSGCTRKTHLQCEQNNTVGKQDEFLKFERVKIPDHFKLYRSSGGNCRDSCLSDCSCLAYAVPAGIGCVHWAQNLTDSQILPYGGDDLYIRLAYSELDKKQDRRAIIATTVVLGFMFVAVCAYVLPKLLLKYRARKHQNDVGYSEESMLHGVKLEELPLFKFQILSSLKCDRKI